MKLKPIQNLTNLEELQPLPTLKPLTPIRISKEILPTQIELILLCSNLLYQSHLIINNKAKRIGTLTVDRCTNQATRLMRIFEDYPNKCISKKQFKEIKKTFKLNRL